MLPPGAPPPLGPSPSGQPAGDLAASDERGTLLASSSASSAPVDGAASQEAGAEPGAARGVGGSLVAAFRRALLGRSGGSQRGQRLPEVDLEEQPGAATGATGPSSSSTAAPSVPVVVVEAPPAPQLPDLEASAAAAAPSSSSGGGGSARRLSEVEARAMVATMAEEKAVNCLICLEPLTQQDFVSGQALALQCGCRGEVALRHRECAMKWAAVRGSNLCELCKLPVRNLPTPPPRPVEEPMAEELYYDPAHLPEYAAPSYPDLVFDCIRVTWVSIIVSVLFFEMNLGSALWTGLLAGLAYSVIVRIMYRQHFAAMQRLAEQHIAAQQGAPPVAGAV